MRQLYINNPKALDYSGGYDDGSATNRMLPTRSVTVYFKMFDYSLTS